MTSENPKAPVYYMDVYDNLVSAPRELVPMHGVSLTNSPAALANQRLLMDALNTRHECGLSPRELLDQYQDYKAQNARLTVALRNLCKHFPTDTYMQELGWEPEYVETACQAYDDARAALAKHKEV